MKLIGVGLIAALLAGCPKTTIPDPEPTDTTYPSDSSSSSTSGADGASQGGGEMIDDPFAGELAMVVYFDFDSSEVRPEDQDVVARHAQELASNPTMSVRLEGNTDERGSREYNIGLGERRAQSVRQMLMIQGVSASQISTVSFGEERPAAMGTTEADYALNRRVEFKYTN
jgi:peptidoglycan-associated lipoprotein